MKKQLLFATLVLLGLTAVLTPTASAQNMDLSWGIRAQAQYQAIGDYNARAAAMAYYNYMLRLRQMGYTGPSLPTGVTPQSLQAPGCTRLRPGSMVNSNTTSNAVGDYDLRAIRGCAKVYYGPQASGVYACPGN